MKNSKRQWPKRAIALFVLIVVVIYALIFLTGNRQGTPKLGIDLQGGTRVTLAPHRQVDQLPLVDAPRHHRLSRSLP